MQIFHFPHPALRFESVDVQRIDPTLRKTIDTMFELMYEAKGIGLAANQVGLPFRFFIVNLAARPDEKDEEHVFINPVIRKRKGTEQGEEGCLSLPNLFADVKRSEEVIIEAFDLKGQGFAMELDDLAARVVQHELDHLDGVMFTDKLAEQEAEARVTEALQQFEASYKTLQSENVMDGDEVLLADLQKMAAHGGVTAEFLERPKIELRPPVIS